MEDKLKEGVEENIFAKSTPDPTKENKIYFRNVHITLHNNRSNFSKSESRDFFNGPDIRDNYISQQYLESLKGQKLGKTIIAAVHGGQVAALGGYGVTLNTCLPEGQEEFNEGVNRPICGTPEEDKADITLKTVLDGNK